MKPRQQGAASQSLSSDIILLNFSAIVSGLFIIMCTKEQGKWFGFQAILGLDCNSSLFRNTCGHWQFDDFHSQETASTK